MPEVPNNYIRLANSERRPVEGSTLIGPANENELIKVTITVRRRPLQNVIEQIQQILGRWKLKQLYGFTTFLRILPLARLLVLFQRMDTSLPILMLPSKATLQTL